MPTPQEQNNNWNIRLEKRGHTNVVMFGFGNQSFELAYSGTKKEVKWMASMLKYCLDSHTTAILEEKAREEKNELHEALAKHIIDSIPDSSGGDDRSLGFIDGMVKAAELIRNYDQNPG